MDPLINGYERMTIGRIQAHAKYYEALGGVVGRAYRDGLRDGLYSTHNIPAPPKDIHVWPSLEQDAYNDGIRNAMDRDVKLSWDHAPINPAWSECGRWFDYDGLRESFEADPLYFFFVPLAERARPNVQNALRKYVSEMTPTAIMAPSDLRQLVPAYAPDGRVAVYECTTVRFNPI